MAKKKTIKVEKYDREKSSKVISIQFPESGYYSNKWLTIQEARQLAQDILDLIGNEQSK